MYKQQMESSMQQQEMLSNVVDVNVQLFTGIPTCDACSMYASVHSHREKNKRKHLCASGTHLCAHPKPFAPMAVRLPAAVPPLLDVFPVNDEIAMVRYRLRLHAPHAYRTIIAESSLTHTGKPKPLHVHDSLAPAELRRHNVRLVEVNFTEQQRARANCSAISCAYVLEIGQRLAVNQAILEELSMLPPEQLVLVHMSDVDELLDLDALPSALPLAAMDGVPSPPSAPPGASSAYHGHRRIAPSFCVSPWLRLFVYSEHCPCYNVRWTRSTLASRAWVERFLLGHNLTAQLRKMEHHAGCRVSANPLGWHFSYAFDSAQIVHKLKSFLHAHDGPIRSITARSDAARIVDARVRRCIDTRGLAHQAVWSAFDGRLPSLPGWPRHPHWANASSMPSSALAREREALRKEEGAAQLAANATNAAAKLAMITHKLAAVEAELDRREERQDAP